MNTSAIDNVLNEFLAQFDLTCSCGTDYMYDYAHNEVIYALAVSERSDKLFMEYAKSIGLECNVDVFLLSLLHEVGHAETMDDLDDEDIYYSEVVKDVLSDTDNDFRIYFDLPIEKVATEWAVDYINTNAAWLKLWWEDKMQPALMSFYKQYNVH